MKSLPLNITAQDKLLSGRTKKIIKHLRPFSIFFSFIIHRLLLKYPYNRNYICANDLQYIFTLHPQNYSRTLQNLHYYYYCYRFANSLASPTTTTFSYCTTANQTIDIVSFGSHPEHIVRIVEQSISYQNRCIRQSDTLLCSIWRAYKSTCNRWCSMLSYWCRTSICRIVCHSYSGAV